MASMIGVLVFANWAKPDVDEGVWSASMRPNGTSPAPFGLLFTLYLCEVAQGKGVDRRSSGLSRWPLLRFFSRSIRFSPSRQGSPFSFT